MTPDDEALPEVELDMEEDAGSYPDTLSCQDGQAHFGVDAQAFLAFWLAKIGCEVEGSALLIGEGLSIAIIHPETGKALTIPEIVKLAKPGPTRVQ